jgi:hypothetical protein
VTTPEQSDTGLFREKAVSAIDSVERFDEAISIVSARGIIALSIIGGLLVLAMIWSVFGRVPVGVQGRGVVVAGSGIAPVTSPAEGTLIELPAHVGDMVAQGEAIARMRTSTGDIVALRAPVAGMLAQRSPALGSFVRSGDAIATIEPSGAAATAVVFVPVETDRRVAPGMAVQLSPADSRPDVFGFLRGHVIYAAPLPATADRIKAALQNDAVAAEFSPEVPVREVHVALDVDSSGNLVWSGLQNSGRGLSAGIPCYVTIVVEERPPISFLLPQTHG